MKLRALTSLQNPLVKQVVRLKDRRDRDETKQFIIEGYREIKRALDHNIELEALLVCPDLFLGINEEDLIELAGEKGADVFETTKQVFHKISYRDRPDGLVAIANQMNYGLESLPLSKNPFFVIAESIEKPGNLGTILRSADAANVDGVIVCDRCTDIYNPNVVRASVGTLFTRPVVEATSDEMMEWLKKHSIPIVAATPHAEAFFTKVDLSGPIAIVVGTEQIGLTDQWMDMADIKVRIPMLGSADSLNVATATTLLLYEVLRQRGIS